MLRNVWNRWIVCEMYQRMVKNRFVWMNWRLQIIHILFDDWYDVSTGYCDWNKVNACICCKYLQTYECKSKYWKLRNLYFIGYIILISNITKDTLKTMSLNPGHVVQSINLTSMNNSFLKESTNIFNEYTNWKRNITIGSITIFENKNQDHN